MHATRPVLISSIADQPCRGLASAYQGEWGYLDISPPVSRRSSVIHKSAPVSSDWPIGLRYVPELALQAAGSARLCASAAKLTRKLDERLTCEPRLRDEVDGSWLLQLWAAIVTKQSAHLDLVEKTSVAPVDPLPACLPLVGAFISPPRSSTGRSSEARRVSRGNQSLASSPCNRHH